CSATRYANRTRPCRPGKRCSSITTPSVSTATRPARKIFSRNLLKLLLADILPRFRGAFLRSRRGIVEKVLRCDCGFEARGEHEDDLVAAVQSHAREAHGMTLSRGDGFLFRFRADVR